MKNSCKAWQRLAAVVALVVGIMGFSGNALAVNAACPDADLFGTGMITHVCWGCVLPIVVSGVRLGGSSDDIPPGAAGAAPLCLCKDNLGVYQPGTQMSMWQPARLVEVVRIPYCSPVMGGIMLQKDPLRIGGPEYKQEQDPGHLAFYQYHYFAFPLMIMLDLFLPAECHPDGFADMDMMYISELDPLWNDDELAFYLNPESAIFANPVAMSACIVDAISTVAGGPPMEKLFWCVGGWGSLYPMTGNVRTNTSPPRTTSLIATRGLASMHRKGLARQTMGDKAMCENPLQPTLPKTQYKFEQLYPRPESNGNHWIGAPTFLWGEWRNIPAVGEDFVHMIWRWNDCCKLF